MQHTPVTPKTFFTDYLLNPLSNEISKTDRVICLIASVVLGIFSLGMLHLGFAIYNWQKHKVTDISDKAPLLASPRPLQANARSPETKKDITNLDSELLYTLEKIQEARLEDESYRRLEELANEIVRNAKQLIIECTEEPKLRTSIIESTKSELSSLLSIGPAIETNESCQKSFNEIKWVQDMSHAIRVGDEAALRKAIAEGIDINHRAPLWLDGIILHHLGKLGRHPHLVDVLAEKGIDFNIIDQWGNSALMWAIANGNNSMVDKMLDYEQNLDVICHGNAALHLVIAKGYKHKTYSGSVLKVSNLQLMQKLIEKGAEVNTVSRTGYTPLHIACIRHDPKMIQALLTAGADPKALTADGTSCSELLNLSHEEAKAILRKITPPFLLPEKDFVEDYQACVAQFNQ